MKCSSAAQILAEHQAFLGERAAGPDRVDRGELVGQFAIAPLRIEHLDDAAAGALSLRAAEPLRHQFDHDVSQGACAGQEDEDIAPGTEPSGLRRVDDQRDLNDHQQQRNRHAPPQLISQSIFRTEKLQLFGGVDQIIPLSLTVAAEEEHAGVDLAAGAFVQPGNRLIKLLDHQARLARSLAALGEERAGADVVELQAVAVEALPSKAPSSSLVSGSTGLAFCRPSTMAWKR